MATNLTTDWPEVRLSEVTESFDTVRQPVREADRLPGPYPYFGASGIIDHVDGYLLDGQYLLVAEDGENLRTRKTPIAFLTSGKFWVNNHAHILRGNGQADTRFLAYVFAITDVSGYVTGSTQPKLTQQNLGQIRLRLPPSTTQREIASFLGALDNKIDVNRRISETLEEIARTLFTSWFVDFDPVRGAATAPEDIRRLFPDRLVDSSIGPVPEGWEVAPLSAVMTVSRDSLDPGGHPDELFEHFSLPAYDARRNPANERGADIKSAKLRVLDGCILLSKLNPRIPRVWWPSASGSSRKIASTEFVVALPRDGVTRSYLFGLFTSAPFRGTLTSLVRGTSGSHQRVAATDLLGIAIVVPPPGIIERFDAIVVPMFEHQEALAAESKTLAELRDTLLPRLISGECRLEARTTLGAERGWP